MMFSIPLAGTWNAKDAPYLLCTTLFGKDEDKVPEIGVIARFDATVEADGKMVCATLFAWHYYHPISWCIY